MEPATRTLRWTSSLDLFRAGVDHGHDFRELADDQTDQCGNHQGYPGAMPEAEADDHHHPSDRRSQERRQKQAKLRKRAGRGGIPQVGKRVVRSKVQPTACFGWNARAGTVKPEN